MEEIKGEIKESVSDREIEKRKKDFVNFFKKKKDWIVYGILAIILFISAFIRTIPIPKLKDITTGTWTLGPDLDPFLFLRWAKYIAENGKLFVMDTMRYVPLADICSGASCNPVNTAGEMNLLSYMIAWLSNFLNFFNKDVTVTYAAIIFPVIMAVLTGIAFFLFARKVFYKEDRKTANIIALVSTAFFVLLPSLLPRSIAGIPEKESAAFFFIFMGFYLFLEAFTSEKLKKGIIFGVLAGVSTGVLALVWGGFTFMFLVIPGAVLFSFLLGKVDEKRFAYYASWLLISAMIMIPFSARYTIANVAGSVSTGLALAIFFVILTDWLIFKKNIFGVNRKLEKIKIPKKITSIIIAGIILIVLASIFFGISFVPNMVKSIISDTIQPLDQNRFSVTVAENKQPYFTSEWMGEFGPVVFNIPLYFWLFFVGSIFLFSNLLKSLERKEKIILTSGYILFLVCLIFSKYSSGGILNGESSLSIIIYLGGFLFFVGSLVYFYIKKNKEANFGSEEINFTYILYLFALTMAIIAARGAVRLIMVLGAITPIAVGSLIVFSLKKYFKEKEDTKKLFIGILTLIIIISSIFTLWTYYQEDSSIAKNYVPSSYTQQWQKAMAWVRENTPIDSVFAHWWDYGYWVQSLGERATILDGGNAVGYWNHFMGRNVLTGTNERDALDFLYAHNGTHLLIDSTEIGKYSAFSSIGSNGQYDRFSWIPEVFMDSSQTQETNNKTLYVYPIGTAIDEDLVLNIDGKEIFLPRKKAVVAAIAVEQNKEGKASQPRIFFVYDNKQYSQPMRYIYIGKELLDFKSGIEAGLFVYPKLNLDSNNQISLVENGAALYLSERTINSELAKLYLFNEDSDYFKLAHTEDSLIVEELKMQGVNLGNFVYYQGFQGPIKIWEINYPADIKLNPEYLSTDYPEEFSTVETSEYG